MKVYTVAEVTGYLRDLLESDGLLADMWVSGEISNLSQSAAGHLYFTLKDEASQIRCVLFNRARLALELAYGMAAVAHGRISLYEVSGALQLYVDMVQPEGMGILHLEFERLKSRLEAEGLFATARKRPLPPFPQRIGVITSPEGAVLHDITNVIDRRYPLAELLLCPTAVQGEAAVPGIVRAFDTLNATDGVDVVILARGGGSLEELWAFNDERTARAVYASRAPVISGVGHETDITIADLVADVRAPTPSAAAELAVPDREELEGQIESLQRAMAASLSGDIERYRQRTDDVAAGASNYLDRFISISRERLRARELGLASLSPLGTLQRGYALVQRREGGDVVSRIEQVQRGDTIDIKVSDGQFSGRVSGAGRGLQPWMKGFPSKGH